jgi:hypothetical protein
LVLFAFLPALVSPLWAEYSTGTISGTVTDQMGAVVVGVTIDITNEATGVHTSAQTGSAGGFAMPALMVGSYNVTIRKQGFETFVKTGILVHPAVVTTVDAVIKVGNPLQTVTVVASAAQVRTLSGEMSGEIDSYEVQTLPLNGRNYEALGQLMPGVTNVYPGQPNHEGGWADTHAMAVNGMGENAGAWMVDGGLNGNISQSSILPSPDSIEEVRVLQSNYSVQYNVMGANTVNVITKSGTDQFHGTAYEYFRNDDLNARNFFSPNVPPLKENLFGYTVGGPVYIPNHFNTNKDKMFFFWTEDWSRNLIASTQLGNSPTASQRSGVWNSAITDPLTGQPFPQNSSGQWVIPSDRLNVGSLALLNAQAPLPNYGSGFTNYLNPISTTLFQRQDEIKVDYNFTPKLRLMAEYMDMGQTETYPNNIWENNYTTGKVPIISHNKIAHIQLTALLSPSMVNTIGIATNVWVPSLTLSGVVYQNQVPALQEVLPFGTGGFLADRLPNVGFSQGYQGLGAFVAPLYHVGILDDQLSDDWSWMASGKHFVQAGFNVVLGVKRQTNFSADNGNWFFSGQFTGDAMADYLLGDAASLYQQTTETRPYVRYKYLGPYVQDRWKVTRRLTVNAGIRATFVPIPQAQRDYESDFVPALYNPANAPIVNADGSITPTSTYNPLNGIIMNGVNGVPLNFQTNAKNWVWAPSVGLAWDVFGDGKTALRAGYGITYHHIPAAGDNAYNMSNNPPMVQGITLITPSWPNSLGGKVAPPGAPSLAAEPTNMQPAGMMQTDSVTLEHQFGGNWFGSIGYAGTIGHHFPMNININQPLPDPPYNYNPGINAGTAFEYTFNAPYPGYASIGDIIPESNLYWNALLVSVRHPVGKNLWFTAAYTWEHAVTNLRGNGFLGGSGYQDAYHPGADNGTGNANVDQKLNLSYIWNLPNPHARGIEGAALDGWKYSGLASFMSGFALDPGLSIPNQGLATRPNRISSDISGPKTVNKWFNTGAFAAPAWGYFGNAANGSITGPGFINFDMALYKDFRIKERCKFELRGEVFNTFNHTNFNGVSTSFGSGNFGQVDSASSPRVAEFALRFEF